MKSASYTVLRIGIAVVMIWFGTQQLVNPEPWVGFLPAFTHSLPISQITFIYINGWFELVFGIALAIGFYTRIVAFFLGLHMLGIVFTLGTLGSWSVAVRDFGLTVALVSLFLHGPSKWSLDEYLEEISM